MPHALQLYIAAVEASRRMIIGIHSSVRAFAFSPRCLQRMRLFRLGLLSRTIGLLRCTLRPIARITILPSSRSEVSLLRLGRTKRPAARSKSSTQRLNLDDSDSWIGSSSLKTTGEMSLTVKDFFETSDGNMGHLSIGSLFPLSILQESGPPGISWGSWD